jgi:hypothetical protein
MNPTESLIANRQSATQAVLPPGTRLPPSESSEAAPPSSPRRSGYGLPCAKCRTYYAADVAACPVCKCVERVSPAITGFVAASPAVEALPDAAAVEEERERFLREFKSQSYAGQMEINASASFRCTKEENHPGGAFEPATVCVGCFEHLQERVDLLEAALHMDAKEATRIIYDAVWSDPSDPSKTYQNAAQALLNEMHRRAGISAVLGPLQPLTH